MKFIRYSAMSLGRPSFYVSNMLVSRLWSFRAAERLRETIMPPILLGVGEIVGALYIRGPLQTA